MASCTERWLFDEELESMAYNVVSVCRDLNRALLVRCFGGRVRARQTPLRAMRVMVGLGAEWNVWQTWAWQMGADLIEPPSTVCVRPPSF